MNRRIKATEQGSRRNGRLSRWLRSWISDPVSFSLDLDQRELDHYLMDPECRVAQARAVARSMPSGTRSMRAGRPSRASDARRRDALVA